MTATDMINILKYMNYIYFRVKTKSGEYTNLCIESMAITDDYQCEVKFIPGNDNKEI